MILKKGDIFDDEHYLDFIGITTNSILNKKGELVMGAGIAKQAKQKHPDLPKLFGDLIKEKDVENKFYGMLLAKRKYVAFQTKLHWKDNSPLDVVQRSIIMLKKTANKYADKTFGIPFPAINNGGLTVEIVLPLLQEIPDNVIIYHLEGI